MSKTKEAKRDYLINNLLKELTKEQQARLLEIIDIK